MCGKFAEACPPLEEGLVAARELTRSSEVAYNSVWLSLAQVHLGLHDRAHASARESLTSAQGIWHQYRIGLSLHVLGLAAVAQGAYAEAERRLTESAAKFREGRHRDGLGQAQACLAYAARGLGKPDQAREHLREAVGTAVELGAYFPLIYALPAMALLLADEGETERAVELYALASQSPFVANSAWFEDVAGKHIAATAEALPPDVVAAAQERGRARDLWDTARELLEELGPEQDQPSDGTG